VRSPEGGVKRLGGGLIGVLTTLLRGLVSVISEVLRIAREMLVIPAQLWLAIAEPAGAAVFAVWRRLLVPVAVTVASLARSALAWAQVQVTPARAALVVAVGAAVALAVSQFVDYRGISVGTPAYEDVQTVAPAPEVDRGREQTGAAHAWVMLPLATAALVVIVLAARGRWRLARLLIPLGLIVIAVGVLVDRPAGLDEGGAATAYEGAEAVLLEGFWAQLAAGAALIASGPLLAARLRPQGAPIAPRRRAWRRRGRSTDEAIGSSPVSGSPIGWEKSNPAAPGTST
jgi:hypothetical protein